ETDSRALPTRLDFRKLLAAGRAYTVVARTDVNLVYYRDVDLRRNYAGVSLSRYFGSMLELHAEGLGTDAASTVPLPALPAVDACGPAPQPWRSRWSGTGIAGGRVDWPTQTYVSFEYLFNGNGYDAISYRALTERLPCFVAA